MRKLHDFKQVIGHMCHQNAGSVPVKERKGERLHMLKDIPAHIRLDQRAHPVPDNRNKILIPCPQQIAGKQNSHNQKKGRKHLFRQERIHRVSGYIRKNQIHQRNGKGKQHVQSKRFPVRQDIGGENGEITPVEINFSVHKRSSSFRFPYYATLAQA